MKRRVNVRGIIINDKGELFCQRLTARNEDGRNFWCTPGGGLDPLESLTDGLRRHNTNRLTDIHFMTTSKVTTIAL